MNKFQRRALIMAMLALLASVALVVAQGSRILFPMVARGPVSTGQIVARINFQPAASVVPAGYAADTGAVFGPRTSGVAFGWNADNSATTRDRDADRAPDQRYDTIIHFQKQENPQAVWEIELDPGVYQVYLVAGDPAFFDGHFRLAVEGHLALDGDPTPIRPFVEGFTEVAVTDGRLTVSSADGAVNNKLAFLEIYRPPGPEPTVTPTGSPPQPTPLPTLTPTTEPPEQTEFRGLWVTRFDWTRFGRPADPAKIDEIVDNAAAAGFNAIFFQVRGSADAFYVPGLEPWASRVSGQTLGTPPDPLWDPLTYFIFQAHAQGIQLHAYINVHPVWDNCAQPPPLTQPTPLYFQLRDADGTTNGKLNGLQWTSAGEAHCNVYWRSSPASSFANDHIVKVAADLVNRYDIDGLHLDNVRYAGGSLSCDPVSAAAYGAPCFSDGGYADWQRSRIDQLVKRIYDEVTVPASRKVWLSAAVWPIYQDKWGWGARGGYDYYYQDSQAWVQGGYIDSISPMIYPGTYHCPDDSFWSQSRWETLVGDFQENRGGRYVVSGIGTGYCTFDEIEARINASRQMGTIGHALFSYGALLSNAYFDDLANGPYAEPAAVPPLPWHE